MSTRLRTTDSGRVPYRLSAAQVESMIEHGIIPVNVDLELVGGVLYKMVKKEPHNFAVGRMADALRGMLPEGLHVREEKSLRHGKRSLPEPDVVVARGRAADFRPRPPSTSEVPLIVEICHHTRKADYHDKCRRYADAGVPEYWVVDLHERRVVAFRSPTGSGPMASYAEAVSYESTGAIPVVLDGRMLGGGRRERPAP
ncbi:MAG: Uma2 family endonuclease [Isosphaeraceae bacterium]